MEDFNVFRMGGRVSRGEISLQPPNRCDRCPPVASSDATPRTLNRCRARMVPRSTPKAEETNQTHRFLPPRITTVGLPILQERPTLASQLSIVFWRPLMSLPLSANEKEETEVKELNPN